RGSVRAVCPDECRAAEFSPACLQPADLRAIRPYQASPSSNGNPMAEELPFKKTMIFAYGEPRELAPGVVRIVANNPNHFTFKGTNTYLLGAGPTLALIDPGPEDPAHLKAILDTVGERKISHVIITHTHRDHTDGMPALLAATGAKTVGFGHRATNRGTKRTSPSGGEYVEEDFAPDVPLLDGQRLDGDGWAVTALHTPGH